MSHYMLDIETLGTDPDAMILSVGVAQFFIGKDAHVGATFYRTVALIKGHGSIDPETIRWWMMQNDKARGALLKAGDIPHRVYQDLRDWVRSFNEYSIVWARGPSFDCVILKSAFDREDVLFPWSFWNYRDCRTLKWAVEDLGWEKPERTGEEHNALDDAVYQAECVISQIRHMEDCIG